MFTRPALLITLIAAPLAAPASAQSNAVAGTDVYLYDVGFSTIYGRRGPAYPNGEVGVGFGHAFCNRGTVHIPWQTSPTTSGQMTDIHFKIAFLIARESNGRMEQVSKRETGVKHSRVTYNLGSSQCGTCQSGPGSTFRIGCFDAYSTGFNGNQFNLGPSSEIDPWTGSWNPVGSYFDRGDPDVGPPNNNDGTQSLTSGQVSAFDSVKNRVTVNESDLAAGGTFYGQVHLVCEGEPVANRGDNLRSARLNFNYGGNWSVNTGGGQVAGSVLNQWTNAEVELVGNNGDDGRFAVAVVVTEPSPGNYHYEYAVHNIDNYRGAASFRIPLPHAINVSNAGFRDIDGNALNEWTYNQTASEMSWTAPAGNSIDWNTIYNFYFDSTEPPGQGGLLLDQARVGPGLLTLSMTTTVPGGVEPARIATIGSSCGDCEPSVYEAWNSAAGFDLANSAASFTFNNGAYSVGSGSATYQTPTGTNLNLGDDAEAVVNLPFSLPYPNGSTNQLYICSNGFVSPVSGNGTLWLPFSSLLLNQQPRWALAWHDLDPSLAAPGEGVIYDSSPTGASVTWLNVPNSGGGGSSTFQIQFEPNGNVHYVWGNMTNAGNGYLVGWSPGQGAPDPGNTDLSAALPGGIDLCASVPQQISLTVDARPIMGTTIQHVTSDIAPSTPFGIFVISTGQSVPPINLAQYGMDGCFAHTSGGVNEFFYPAGASSVSIPLFIPNSNSLMGIYLYSQSYAYVPPLTAIGLIASNAVELFIGPL